MNRPGSSFFDFWKLPSQKVVFTGEEDVDQPALVKIRMPSPTQHKPTPALYRWGAGRFYASLFPWDGSRAGDAVLDAAGHNVAWVNLDQASRTITLPFNLDEGIWNLLEERYLEGEKDQALMGWLRRAYYALKPWMPRWLQMSLRRKSAVNMSQRTFPAWPIDSSVDDLQFNLVRLILAAVPDHVLPMLSFWPQGNDFCLVLTHDVETQVGFDNIEKIASIERKYGFRSAWNFVAERYPVNERVLQSLRDDGFEVGVHGLYHDGKMFQSRQRFLAEARQINFYLEHWQSSGFRSPSLLRNLEWLSQHIQAEDDSSLPSSEHYGAQPGGCCTVFPFVCPGCNERMVELPVSMPQDHTLLETLNLPPGAMLENWLETVQKIKSLHGMALLIVHPDYQLTNERLEAYERFLQAMKAEESCWFALPKEAARWWRERYQSHLMPREGEWVIDGPAADCGQVMALSAEQGQLKFQPWQSSKVGI